MLKLGVPDSDLRAMEQESLTYSIHYGILSLDREVGGFFLVDGPLEQWGEFGLEASWTINS